MDNHGVRLLRPEKLEQIPAPAPAAPVGLPSQRSIEPTVESYRRLADVFHDVLSEQRVDLVLERIADTLAELIPYDTLTIYEADERKRVLNAVTARDPHIEHILKETGIPFGEGITGWAVEHGEAALVNDSAHDPRAIPIPGTPQDEHEACITVPLITRDSVKGALNIYRIGVANVFSPEEFELAKRFGDAAALALDNAQVRASLEHQAQTDSLTGLYNHRFFHERVRSELTRANRVGDSLVVLMLDIDDFKAVNDIHGHSVGDQILVALAEMVAAAVRGSDVVCRIGGEEFAVIMPSCEVGDALGFASRLTQELAARTFDPADRITLSIGIAQGPAAAAHPRELVAFAETAMMVAKADGKNRAVVFGEDSSQRPSGAERKDRDVRSLAHMKMLQSLAGKLNRLNDVHQIGTTIVNELRTFIDYDVCRVYVVEGDECIAVAANHLTEGEGLEELTHRVGEGITGSTTLNARPLLIPNSQECEFACPVTEIDQVPQSVVAVPLRYGPRVVGVIVVTKLSIGALDEDDLRLLEVLAGHASVAIENAQLYEMQRREAGQAKALLEFAQSMLVAPSLDVIGGNAVRMAATLLGAKQSSLWLLDQNACDYYIEAHYGYEGDPGLEAEIDVRLDRATALQVFQGQEAEFVSEPQSSHPPAGMPRPLRIMDWSSSGAGASTSPGVVVALQLPSQPVAGWLMVRHPGVPGWDFSQERLRLLAGVAQQASLAIEKLHLLQQQTASTERASALLRFSFDMSTSESLNDVIAHTVEHTAEILECPKTSLWLEDPETGGAVAQAVWGYAVHELTTGTRANRVLMHRLLLGEGPYVMHPEDYAQLGRPGQLPGDCLVALAPLKMERGRLGCVMAVAPNNKGFEFSEQKLRLMASLAYQAQIAIAKELGLQTIEESFRATVEALANALEAKDAYTSSHARWIASVAVEVGEELGLGDESLKNLELGALFHDIGKIGVPSTILSKPGPLSEPERLIVHKHPEIGERILSPVERLGSVCVIVKHCHERYDGMGYPDRLAGDDVPIESRIILVCDSFHAMTTDRPYRARMSMEEAFHRLQAAAGSQVDPKVVDAFLRVIEERPEPGRTP
ncbi:MAG: GAF domain-containing protein [Actinobacteria bacterium]|nr:GAF domain-containing protein [Actinomycetota bacterium]